MKKIIIISVYLIICVGALRAQRSINLHTMQETKGVTKTITTRDIEDTKDGIMVTYRFDNVILQKDPLYANATTIKIDGFWPNSNVSEPAVLSRWDTFAVPDASAKIIMKDSSYVEFPLELSPARPILSNGGSDFYSKNNVVPIAGYKGLFPSNSISATRNDSYRGQQLLDICITPVQYDFVNKKVRVYTMIQYCIQYSVTAFEKSISRFANERTNGNSFLENIILNYPSRELTTNPKSATSSVSSKYLIVSVPKYSTAVNRFAEWKRTLGFNVQIAMRESWDTTTVKNVVSTAYQTDNIEYLLIIGGHSDVPGIIRNKYFNSRNHYHPTDLYYGCMSNGYTPDIFRGRILVNTGDEAMAVVDKIINYEKNPVSDEFFYKRGVHCAYFQDKQHFENGQWLNKDSCEDRRFVLTSERIRDGMLSVIDSITRIYKTETNTYPKYWSLYDYANGEEIPDELQKPTFEWDGDSIDINNCINQKAFYVLIRDHGSDSTWIDPSYTRSNIKNLSNGSYLPVVFSICCHTGKFDVANCFCESFLKKENGGCVAIYGATQSSLSGPNDVMAEGMFDAIWPSLNLRPRFGIINNVSYSPTPTPTYRLGQILDQGLKRCDEAYLNTNKAWYPRYTSELFHCYGDPSMMIYTDRPTEFSSASIIRNNGQINVSTGGETATIAFYDRHTGSVESYIGTSASHVDDPHISVCISAHNKIPYIDGGILYIQNQTLSEDGYYEAKTIKVGNHVTTTQSQGDVIFNQGNFQLVGKEIELHPGTTVSSGATLEISNN